MSADFITRYYVTLLDGIRAFCLGCDQERPVWSGATATGEILVGCAVCQRILRRHARAK